MGNYIALSDTFMNSNKKKLSFTTNSIRYKVTVTRESLFTEYNYLVEKVDLTDLHESIFSTSIKNYDDIVQIDNQVTCAVTD